MQYRHNFKIRLKNILNNKTQESGISHAWLVIHGPCVANYTLVSLGTGKHVGQVTGEHVDQATSEHVGRIRRICWPSHW